MWGWHPGFRIYSFWINLFPKPKSINRTKRDAPKRKRKADKRKALSQAWRITWTKLEYLKPSFSLPAITQMPSRDQRGGKCPIPETFQARLDDVQILAVHIINWDFISRVANEKRD